MKKISRRSFITAMAAVSAAGVLAACGSSSSSTASSVASSAVSSEATSSAASMDETGTHTVVDHGGNEVEVPNKVTRVVIDQIPILSTYMAYFEGSAPYIVGYCGSFKSVISDTVLKNIAPELLESSDTVYAQSDLNIEEIMKLNPDVILYNAGNSSHAEILKASGIPSIGFATVGASTEADPIERYEEWLKLLEQIFNEPGKTDAFVAAGDEIVTDVEARIAEIPQTDAHLLIPALQQRGLHGDDLVAGGFQLSAAVVALHVLRVPCDSVCQTIEGKVTARDKMSQNTLALVLADVELLGRKLNHLGSRRRENGCFLGIPEFLHQRIEPGFIDRRPNGVLNLHQERPVIGFDGLIPENPEIAIHAFIDASNVALANAHISHHAIGADKAVNQRLHGNAAHADLRIGNQDAGLNNVTRHNLGLNAPAF